MWLLKMTYWTKNYSLTHNSSIVAFNFLSVKNDIKRDDEEVKTIEVMALIINLANN